MSLKRILLLLTVFSIAMGFLETAVVIYLRELYYPKGFSFPLVTIPQPIAIVEFFREAATLIMLVGVGILAGKTAAQRFCFFLYCFAVWDICYYIFLKLFLGWPQSLFTWDILFLIPVPWVGPVLAPCMASLTMIVITLLLVYYHEKNIAVRFARRDWVLLISGAAIMMVSFIQDYIVYVSHNHHAAWMPGGEQKLFDEFAQYVPASFNWPLFMAGQALLIVAIFRLRQKMERKLLMTTST
jgi:hypothetical protein